jgi:nucleoside-diphosphate-sugar epimerase
VVKTKRTIAITGGSGFIGIALVEELIKQGDFRIKILSRRGQDDTNLKQFGSRVEVVTGDLLVPESLNGFLVPGCTLVHLGYIKDDVKNNNLDATANLIAACKEAKIKRLIHISTAAVTGRTKETLINEETPCNPVTHYGITKLKIEEAIKKLAGGDIDVVILRPTSVFGHGGGSLVKLYNDLRNKRTFKNYLKACLFNCRRMNLIYVQNVVAALIFIYWENILFAGDTFIISEDDYPSNNFEFVESVITKLLDLNGYVIPVIPIPLKILSLLLKILGRNNINPMANYSSQKLLDLGFKRTIVFEDTVSQYIKNERS